MRPPYTAQMRLAASAAALLLAACGQTGALYLPDAGVETPVEIRGPSAPAPAPQPDAPPATEEEEEAEAEKKKNGPLAGL
ncbi:MAG: LPS translocon maturation chaperone LptM [Gammaproteobacteria bacterium]